MTQSVDWFFTYVRDRVAGCNADDPANEASSSSDNLAALDWLIGLVNHASILSIHALYVVSQCVCVVISAGRGQGQKLDVQRRRGAAIDAESPSH